MQKVKRVSDMRWQQAIKDAENPDVSEHELTAKVADEPSRICDQQAIMHAESETRVRQQA